MGFALSQRLVVMKEYQAAYIYITLEDQKKFNVQKAILRDWLIMPSL